MSNLTDTSKGKQGKSTGSGSGPRPVESSDEAPWTDRLRLDGSTTDPHIIPNLYNTMLILSEAPGWAGRIVYNENSRRVMLRDHAPWGAAEWTGPRQWLDTDEILTAEWLERVHHVTVSVSTVAQAVLGIASLNPFHPIRDYLSSLDWDGEPRIDFWLSTCLGADHCDIVSAFGSKFLISAVARIFRPGCKVDTCLILEGAQGTLKSTALRILFSDAWFTDQIPDVHNKDASIQLDGKWLVEFSDLSQFEGAHASNREHLKAYLSRLTDCYRPVNGKQTIDVPRQTVFAGTTNKQAWLSDDTGGRRFWPVKTGFINLDYLLAERDQLWAEAVERYKSGEKWHLNPQLDRLARIEQAARHQTEPWQETVEDFIRGKRKVSSDAVLLHIKPKRSKWKQADKNQIARCLNFAGWERYNDHKDPAGRQKWMYRPKKD